MSKSEMKKSKILFILTGSIACYKACQAISRLVQSNCEVQVVATAAALKFVGNATFEGLTGKTAVSDLYAAGSVMDHIHLMRWADLILVAPATANFINKASQGIADDLVSTLFLAHDFKKPFLVAPAMNSSMYLHPTTQSSLVKLKAMGIELLDTTAGILACGEEGYGRLLEPDQIQKRVLELLNSIPSKTTSSSSPKVQQKSSPIKILITAGGTQEPIDDVRVITNLSTGATGAYLAEAFCELGCEVLLLRAQNAVPASSFVQQDTFTSFASLQKKLQEHLKEDFSYVIHLAAVSDYSVNKVESQGQSFAPSEIHKLNSEADEITLRLKKNPKLVDLIKSYSTNEDLQLVAFKLTSQANVEQKNAAVQKLFSSKNVDYVVHNDLSDFTSCISGEKKNHRFTLYTQTTNQPPGLSQGSICENKDQLVAKLSSFWMG